MLPKFCNPVETNTTGGRGGLRFVVNVVVGVVVVETGLLHPIAVVVVVAEIVGSANDKRFPSEEEATTATAAVHKIPGHGSLLHIIDMPNTFTVTKIGFVTLTFFGR